MPIVTKETAEKVASRILQAAGAPERHARVVAEHLADSNLAGHDSHGLIRIPQYLQAIESGRLKPAEEPTIVRECATTALIDGHWTFGQVVANYGVEVAVSKAKAQGTAFVCMFHEGHTGRIGTYPEMVAREDMAAIMWDGVIGGPWANLAPFGGRLPKMGANPFAMAFPSNKEGPILLDFATSMCAEGKVRVARARGKRLPDKWVLDSHGVPSDNPNDFYEGGALLPAGGLSVGHKGYCLAFMVGLFGLMASMGSSEPFPKGHRWGSALMVVNISRFTPVAEFKKLIDQAIAFVKDTPPMAGFKEVLYPGEFETRNRRERLVNGIPVEDATWNAILECVRKLGLERELGPLLK